MIPYSTSNPNGPLYWARTVWIGGCGNGALDGDSGGPVYSSDSRAYGIVSGAAGDCKDQMVYTAISYAMQRWGVAIPR